MCGIIGYVGEKNAAPILFEGLKKLEYRGYDSSYDFISNDKVFESSNNIANSPFVKNFQQMQSSNMKIFNFIKNEDYYAIIDENLQKLLSSRIKSGKVELSKKIGASYQTLQRILKSKNYWANLDTLFKLFRALSIEESYLTNNIRQLKTKNSFSIEVKRFKLSEELMRILGHIIGDGGIHLVKNESKYRPFYVNNEEILLNAFRNDVKSVFGGNKIYFRKRIGHGDELWLQTSIGRILYDILEYEINNDKKRIPSFVYGLEENLICKFLQALYDDEGYIYPKKNMIVIAQKYRDLVNDLRNAVEKVGIRPNQILVHKSKDRTTMHYFSISGKDNILLFAKKIGFLHPEKKKKLEILTNKYRGK
ncbi:hypothetical protein HYU09_01560 [Candidatus Woesearchaeota archaeon]|nr:hypothetical protein [Candidatus Woesearchaeota archaeon]